MKSAVRILFLALAAVALAGCNTFRQSCEAPLAPEETATIPALRMPIGVPPPDTSNALRIPELNVPEPPRGANAPCLETPPLYSPGWQPDEKAIAESEAADKAGQQKKRRWWWPWGGR